MAEVRFAEGPLSGAIKFKAQAKVAGHVTACSNFVQKRTPHSVDELVCQVVTDTGDRQLAAMRAMSGSTPAVNVGEVLKT